MTEDLRFVQRKASYPKWDGIKWPSSSDAIPEHHLSAKLHTVAGLQMFVNCFGANLNSRFYYNKCKDGYEVVMKFRGERRFAFCTHENDAEVIVEALNNRTKE